MYSSHVMFCIALIVGASVQLSLAAIGQSCISSRCPNNEVDAYCDNNICSCRKGEYVSSNDKSRCLKLADSLGNGCEEDTQCTEKLSFYAYCTANHQCGCKPEATMVNSVCEKKRFLGDKCTMNQQCSHIPFGSCTSPTPSDVSSLMCTCDVKYAPSSNATACLAIAVTGQAPCEESIQCSEGLGDGAICNIDVKTCGCKENYHFNGDNFSGKCVINKGISDTCSTGTRGECYLPLDGDEQNIDCIDGLCRCKDGNMPRLENQSCKNGARSIAILSIVWVMIISVATTTLG